MDPAALRILDAEFNRAREGLRVLEEHARFVLDDSALTQRLKALRHDLVALEPRLAGRPALEWRDTRHDVGTTASVPTEIHRGTPVDVAAAAARRLGESLRCIEEYGKLIDAGAAEAVEALRYRLYIIEQDMLLTAPRRMRLAQARMHVLITASLCRHDWYRTAEGVLEGGADVIQLREKDMADGELLCRALRLRELTERHAALLVINDRPHIARLAKADGVHVGQGDLSVADARQIAGPTLLVGKSTHSTREIREAVLEEPDYIAVGTMFASPTKPDVRVQGPGLLAEAARMTHLPLVAIGGITEANVARLETSRRVAIAVCQAVIGAEDPAVAARKLRAAATCSPATAQTAEAGS